MFSGAHVALYPMTDRFVPVILDGIAAMKHDRNHLRIETDDLSTLLVGPPEDLFPAMRDLLVGAARSGTHVVLSAHVSRGCPGEPDDPACHSAELAGGLAPASERIEAARAAVAAARSTGQSIAAQIALHPLGTAGHMDEIGHCIAFLRESGVHDRAKHFCTKLGGDAGPVFAAMAEAFVRFGDPAGHVTMTLTASANSPTGG